VHLLALVAPLGSMLGVLGHVMLGEQVRAFWGGFAVMCLAWPALSSQSSACGGDALSDLLPLPQFKAFSDSLESLIQLMKFGFLGDYSLFGARPQGLGLEGQRAGGGEAAHGGRSQAASSERRRRTRFD
jgi:hypothetical protein